MSLIKTIVIILNYALAVFVFGFTNNHIKWAIHNYQENKGSRIIESFSLLDDLINGVPIVLVLYFLFFITRRFVFKKSSTVVQSLSLGLLSYVLMYLLAGSTISDSNLLWISILPILITGFILPLSEKWLSALIMKIRMNKA